MPRLSDRSRKRLLLYHAGRTSAQSRSIVNLVAQDIEYSPDQYNRIIAAICDLRGKDDPETKLWVIQSGYVGNHMLFWRGNNCGYTTNLSDARLWSELDAKKQADQREEDIAWPLSYLYQAVEQCINLERVDYSRRYEGAKDDATAI